MLQHAIKALPEKKLSKMMTDGLCSLLFIFYNRFMFRTQSPARACSVIYFYWMKKGFDFLFAFFLT
jgi:hypothetical protein